MAKQTQRTQLEQGRAAFAYQCAEDGAKLDKKKEYKSYVKKMPMLIKTNGLGAALAFAFSKGAKAGRPTTNQPWGLIYTQIEAWLNKDQKELISFDNYQLAKALTETDSYTYRAVTVEVMALLSWLRRFADALIEGESSEQ
ncbi:MAG: type III-B CRISPR module-associated protein Cmr5 [Bacteroidia bacterium]|nr:type III-B CRISPR module-associated protein Cmr5 [Bacteroidia bacterium]